MPFSLSISSKAVVNIDTLDNVVLLRDCAGNVRAVAQKIAWQAQCDLWEIRVRRLVKPFRRGRGPTRAGEARPGCAVVQCPVWCRDLPFELRGRCAKNGHSGRVQC